MVKVGAHCATDDFRVPQVNGARERDCRARAKSGRRANERSNVSGILNCVEDEDSHEWGRALLVERSRRNSSNGKDSLWGVGIRSAIELGRCNVHYVDTAGSELIAQSSPPRIRMQLR